jgi:hypothetical protein
VGRPGSAVLHATNLSGKATATWTIQPTGQPLPLNGITFFDELRGWAVGELGTILATRDGGKTWFKQHGGGQRAAVLFVHARPGDLPAETVAQLGGADGYLAAALRVNAPDAASADPGQAGAPARFSTAVRLAGGAAGETLWQFPLPQHLLASDKQELLKFWNQAHGNRAEQQLLRQLVLALRTWRPEVVVTDHPDPRTGSPAGALVAEALHQAFGQAADPKAFREQIEHLKLKPWQPARVFAVWDRREGAEVVLDGSPVLPPLQASPNEFAQAAAGLLAEKAQSLPVQRFFRALDSRAGLAAPRYLMDGVALPYGGEARRPQPQATELPPELLRAMKTRQNLQRLAETPLKGIADPSKLLAQIAPALHGLPAEQGAAAAFAVANQYARRGEWELAREAFLLMVDRYPAHPLAVDAYRWLVRHNSSSEARRRHEMGQFLLVTRLAGTKPQLRQDLPKKTKEQLEKEKLPPSHILQGAERERYLTGGETEGDQRGVYLASKEETRQWYRGCLEVGNRLAAFGPLFATDPSTQFCLQAAKRQLGDFNGPRDWYAKFKADHADGPWREAAASELWLIERNGQPPRPVGGCRLTEQKPYLDGKLDDACWQGLKPLVLRNAVGDTIKDYPTEAWLAYDQEYLYLAVRCGHPADRYLAPVKGRTRDADLRAFDRVSLLLDLDRDYSTCFHLQIDQRGCLFEDCWGDKSWNPRWFVAVHSDKTGWCAEAAIPLTELTGDRVTLGTTWACNVVRVLPGRGVQGWSLPADVEPRPEGLGLLMFQQEPVRAARPAAKGP